jgi:hypothetical protein
MQVHRAAGTETHATHILASVTSSHPPHRHDLMKRCPGRAVASTRRMHARRFGLLEDRRIEALGEPAIDRGEKIVGLLSFTLIAPQARHAHRRA